MVNQKTVYGKPTYLIEKQQDKPKTVNQGKNSEH